MVPTYDHRHALKLRHSGVTPLWCRHMTTGRHESCSIVALHRYGADIRPQACIEAAPLWSYTAMVQTYDYTHAWKLHHCGVTPLWCTHTTTRMHGSCTAEALHRYGADIRPQGCTKAAPLWRYAAVVQT